jgi:hypothetical protein
MFLNTTADLKRRLLVFILLVSPAVHALTSNDSTRSGGDCEYKPLSEDLHTPCRARFTTCQTANDNCDQILLVSCRGKTIFKGFYYTSTARHVIKLTGSPYGTHADVPTLVLAFDARIPSPSSSVYSLLNYKGKNRHGECRLGPGPLPALIEAPSID